MFEPPQVTLNGAHCIGVEYDGVNAAVAAGSKKRTRGKDNVWERPHSFPSIQASRPAPKVGESRGTYDFIIGKCDDDVLFLAGSLLGSRTRTALVIRKSKGVLEGSSVPRRWSRKRSLQSGH